MRGIHGAEVLVTIKLDTRAWDEAMARLVVALEPAVRGVGAFYDALAGVFNGTTEVKLPGESELAWWHRQIDLVKAGQR